MAKIYKCGKQISYGLGGTHMENFFEEMVERAHYYEQFEFFKEYKQTFLRNQKGKSKSGRKE